MRHNFLPFEYVQARACRKVLICYGVLLCVSGLVGGASYVYADRQLDVNRHRIGELKSQTEEAQRRLTEYTSLRRELTRLTAQTAAYRRLAPSLETTALIAVIDEMMPPSMGLTELSINSTPVRPVPVQKAGERGQTRSRRKRSKPKPESAGTMVLDLVGLAPTDLVVARFFKDLGEHALFQEVNLTFTRPVDAGNLYAREFHIKALIPLGRRYVMVDGNEGASRAN